MNIPDQIKKRAMLSGRFTLRSGRTSNTYFDKYQFESDPKLLAAIAAQMVPLIPDGTEILAGLEMGGIPIVTAAEQGQYGGGQDTLAELQHWTARFLRRVDASYPDGPDSTDPDVQRECEHMGRAMNRYVGRPDNWTPPQGPCSCRICAPDTRADAGDTDDRQAVRYNLPLSS